MTANIKFPRHKIPNDIVHNRPIRCYDNGGNSADRYTVIYMDEPERPQAHCAQSYAARGMNHEPFHPQGVGMSVTATPGWHLGKRIRFDELPADCQKLVKQDLGPDPDNLPEMAKHYLIAALWSTNDESTPSGGEPLDDKYCISDCAPDVLAQAVEDCAQFKAKAGDRLADWPDEQAGHDFWLTRNGHGTGFWDRNERGTEDIRAELTALAKEFNEINLYVGDDNRIYS